MAVQLWPLSRSTVATGGESVIVAYGPMIGCKIVNPIDAVSQGLSLAEFMYVSLIGPANTQADETTFALAPGQEFNVPANDQGVIYVTAPSSGHHFGGFVIFDPTNFQPSTNPWPSIAPTTLQNLIPSYIYQQYSDDEDLQAFFASYNSFAKLYIDWFVNTQLPVFTNPNVSGALLDWVALGLYGMARPVLPASLITQDLGALNTYAFNDFVSEFNSGEHLGPSTYYVVDDDTFRRILIWHLYKGDGKLFDIRWLKRRVQRFLTGADGSEGDTQQTYNISVTFGVGNQVDINLLTIRFIKGDGALFDTNAFNTFAFNALEDVETVSIPQSPLIQQFKAAVVTGVLELPFQYTFQVNIN